MLSFVILPDRLAQEPTGTLLETYALVLAELRRRAVVRSGNAPAADYGEWLVARALGGELVGPTKSYELLLEDGERIAVRTVTGVRPGEGRAETPVFRSWGFDAVALVLLSETDYSVQRGVLVPRAVVQAASRRSEHDSGSVLEITPELLGGEQTRDLTGELRTAAAQA